MRDPNHVYTLHHTYTGPGCAHCGKPLEEHASKDQLVNGKEVKSE
jgi:hypothetical protein